MNHKDYAKMHSIDTSKPDVPFEMANLITTARLLGGLTQQQLAKRMGTLQPSIARAESGEMEPSASFVDKALRAVGHRLVIGYEEITNTTK